MQQFVSSFCVCNCQNPNDESIDFSTPDESPVNSDSWSVSSWMRSIGDSPLILPHPVPGFDSKNQYFLGMDQVNSTIIFLLNTFFFSLKYCYVIG